MDARQKELLRKEKNVKTLGVVRRALEEDLDLDGYKDDQAVLQMVSDAIGNLDGAYMITRDELRKES